MVLVGADLHKRWHTVVAIDEQGRKLGERTVPATPDGHLELRARAAGYAGHRWGLEDCRHLSRRLEADLLRAGEQVVRVPPKLMAGLRRSGREPGKSDPIDALAVARAPLASPGRPVASLDGPERDVRVLVDHRDDLVAERTRDIARLRWHLHELGVEEPRGRSLDRAGVRRFHSAAAFARHNGTAPVPVWSGNQERHRLSRDDNRQFNLALNRIAITQMRIDDRGRAYIEHRRAAGDTKTEAIRALRRRLSDEVFRRLSTDETRRADAAPALTAVAA